MPGFEYEAPVDLPAEQVFDYASEPANLPDFVSAVTEAHRGEDGRVRVVAEVDGRPVELEVWLRVDAHARTVAWGTGDGSDGELAVRDHGAGTSEVVVRLHTAWADGAEAQRGVEQAVAAMTQGAAAKTDSARAAHQEGWAG
ncbi:SRPBCC family protein [Actinokineospora sp. 24-640]